MEYSLHKLTYDQMKELLTLYSATFLCAPIAENAKYFSAKAKGFRLNKLPMAILYRIYYDEIHTFKDTPLEKFLIRSIEENFKDTEIGQLLDSFDGNIETLLFSLETKVLKAGLKISPVLILEMSTIEQTCEKMDCFRTYHQLILKIQKDTFERAQQGSNDRWEEQIKAEKQQCKTLTEECSGLKNSKDELEKKLTNEAKRLADIVSQRDGEIGVLIEKNARLHETLDRSTTKLKDLKDSAETIEKQKLTIDELNVQIESLKKMIQEIKGKSLSPDDVIDICSEVLDDLRGGGVSQSDLLHKSETIFSSETSILDAWNGLSGKGKTDLEDIIKAMETNTVATDDIDVLDDVENGICIQYMIVKSLKALFFRYLEQKTTKMTIEQNLFDK